MRKFHTVSGIWGGANPLAKITKNPAFLKKYTPPQQIGKCRESFGNLFFQTVGIHLTSGIDRGKCRNCVLKKYFRFEKINIFRKKIRPKMAGFFCLQKISITFSECVRFEFCFHQSTQLTLLRRLAVLLAPHEA